MATKKRQKTKYAGVFYIEGVSASGKPEKIYYIRYRKHGRLIEEKAGRQYQDDMTPAKAAGLRGQRIQSKDKTNEEQREEDRNKKKAEKGRYTIDKLWN